VIQAELARIRGTNAKLRVGQTASRRAFDLANCLLHLREEVDDGVDQPRVATTQSDGSRLWPSDVDSAVHQGRKIVGWRDASRHGSCCRGYVCRPRLRRATKRIERNALTQGFQLRLEIDRLDQPEPRQAESACVPISRRGGLPGRLFRAPTSIPQVLVDAIPRLQQHAIELVERAVDGKDDLGDVSAVLGVGGIDDDGVGQLRRNLMPGSS
jgi:hypothetical protein